MNNEWNPGHSVNKGYPYAGIVSRQAWPAKNRPIVEVDENGTLGIAVNKEVFPDVNLPAVLGENETFLLHRMHDFKRALHIAEDQLDALFEERPFYPERFGFELIHGGKSPFEQPQRIYATNDGKFSLYRPTMDPESKDWKADLYTMMIKKDDGTFHSFDISLPCERIAYAFFYAIGVKMPEIKG